MAVPTLGLPDGPRIRAFRAVDAIFREDPVLSTVVRTFASWNGDGKDKMTLASGMLPIFAIEPVMMPNDLLASGRSVAVLGVRVEVAVAGLVADDLMNFWDAVEDSMVLNKPFRQTTVYCYLQSLGVFVHRFTAPGIGAWRTEGDAPAEFLAGTGMLVLRISRPA